jgi:protein phosphatase
MSSAPDNLDRPGIHPRIHEHPQIRTCDVIGDVHGCYDELAELLGKLGHGDLLDPEIPVAEPGHLPQVIFVGDIVDRGPKVMQSVALVNRLCRRGHALTVVGNHDDRFLRWLMRKQVQIRHGLEQTVKEFDAMTSAQKKWWREELTDFIRALPWALRIDDGRAIVAHASWHADLAHNPSSEQLRTATLYGPTTGRKTAEGYPERIDWAPGFAGPELVIFGHQVYDAPYMHDYAIGIDTGCVFGGSLTALRYPSLEIVSVKSRFAAKR